MSYICALCNGLLPLNLACPDCGQQLEDEGRLQDYAGPYSPYGSIDQITSVQDAGSTCEHIAGCPACREHFIYEVELQYS